MGRTDGKLVTFLRDALRTGLYPNLRWENHGMFSVELPRYERSKEPQYGAFATILIDWYECNGRRNSYISYSNAKAVFQAALKKSVYLISLPPIQRKIVFRFATPEEAKEKRRLLKERERSSHSNTFHARSETPPTASPSGFSDDDAIHEDPFYARPDGSPLSSSSGYSSSDEREIPSPEGLFYVNSAFRVEENEMVVHEVPFYTSSNESTTGNVNSENAEGKKNELMENPGITLDSILNELENSLKGDATTEILAVEDFLDEFLATENVCQTQAEPSLQHEDSIAPVQVKFYWQLYEKSNVDSVLLLSFKKQFFIENEGSNKPGDIVIPNEVWEQREYILKHTVELDEKLFLFFQKK